jgi:Na+/proline symporter
LRTGGEDDASKLTLVSVSTDPSKAYTLWTAVIAFTVMGIGSYGVDHDLAQRMLTCKNSREGGKAAIGAIIAGIPTVALFLVIGLLLWVFYANPGGIAREGELTYEIDDTRKIFLDFIVHEMPPGLTGLMLAGLFAAGLSSLNSALNAMSSTLVCDFLKPLGFIRSAQHEVTVGRMGVCVWGVVLGAFACVCWPPRRARRAAAADRTRGSPSPP